MQMLGQVAHQALGRQVSEHDRHAPNQHRVAAERLDLQAKLGQQLALFEHAGRLVGRQMNRLGNQHAL